MARAWLKTAASITHSLWSVNEFLIDE